MHDIFYSIADNLIWFTTALFKYDLSGLKQERIRKLGA